MLINTSFIHAITSTATEQKEKKKMKKKCRARVKKKETETKKRKKKEETQGARRRQKKTRVSRPKKKKKKGNRLRMTTMRTSITKITLIAHIQIRECQNHKGRHMFQILFHKNGHHLVVHQHFYFSVILIITPHGVERASTGDWNDYNNFVVLRLKKKKP